MTIHEAIDIYNEYQDKSYLTKEEEKAFLDAILFLIEETQDPYFMTYYGGYFYEKRDFKTAKKYYEMAAKKKYPSAYLCLGYIYYYGRVGEPDYDKAFKYYKLASDCDIDEAAYKLADMYKNGYGVQQSYETYVSIIEDLYDKYNHYKLDPASRVGVLTRMARIRKQEGNNDEAIKIFTLAKNIIVDERFSVNPFFGDINVIKWITQDIYSLKEFDYNSFDLFDVFYLLDKVHEISFKCDGKEITIQIDKKEEGYKITCMGKGYASYEEFLNKATLDGEAIVAKARAFSEFKKVK